MSEPTDAGKLHEHALIAADMANEGWTDCSTPLFIRVRNVLAELRKLRSEAVAEAMRTVRPFIIPDRGQFEPCPTPGCPYLVVASGSPGMCVTCRSHADRQPPAQAH